jgi:hypothetical protein
VQNSKAPASHRDEDTRNRGEFAGEIDAHVRDDLRPWGTQVVTAMYYANDW